MKLAQLFVVVVIWGVVHSVALAQDGKVGDTYPELKLKDGRVFKEVKVKEILADGIKVTHADGGSRIPYTQLPDALVSKYGIDPERAQKAAAERKAKEDAQADATLAQQRGEAVKRKTDAEDSEELKRLEGLLKYPEPGKIGVFGREVIKFQAKVIQVLGDSALVGGNEWLNVTVERDGDWHGSNIMRQNFLLVGVSGFVDGDSISMIAYPCGTYSYTNTLGATVTVNRYATSKQLALKYLKMQR